MLMKASVMDDAKLQTIWQQRQFYRNPSALAEPIALLMKRTLGKKVKQLSRLSEIWDEVVPDQIAQHLVFAPRATQVEGPQAVAA